MTFQDVLDQNAALEITREGKALLSAAAMLSSMMKAMPVNLESPSYKQDFKEWRSMVMGYLGGTCKQELVALFYKSTEDDCIPVAAQMFLNGLVNNLSRNDLRSSAKTCD